MEIFPPEDLAALLRAVGDERRLRLFALCAEGPASVSALAAAVADSEPNVSRQLKQLAAVGLVRRERQGQFVEYSAAADASPAAEFGRWLQARLERGDAASRAARGALRRARAAEALRAPGGRAALLESRFGRTLAGALAGHGETRAARVLLRCRFPELILALAPGASRVGLLANGAAERGLLARWALGQGLDAEVEVAATFRDQPGARLWDLVVLDDAAPGGVAAAAIESDARLARSLLAPGGCAWLMADYDQLDSPAGSAGAAPPQRFRGLLLGASLECRDVVPVEAEGRHVLVARSRPLRAAVAPLVRSA